MARARAVPVRQVLVFLLLLVLTVTFLYPVFFMVVNSLKSRTEYFTNPFSMPAGRASRTTRR